MNNLEKQMIEVLKGLKQDYNAIGVKAEFESEGTRFEEMLRLKEISFQADLPMTIKISGCEAVKDMYEVQSIGVSRIVAPMIESQYAFKKFINSVNQVFSREELDKISLWINIETITAYQNLENILSLDFVSEIKGIVVGRGDLAESMNISRHDINNPEIYEISRNILKKAREKSLSCGIGGSVSVKSLRFFKDLSKDLLDFYETRKVIFNYPDKFDKRAANGILKAVEFELMWIKNKLNYTNKLSRLDQNRIKVLESCYEKSTALLERW